MRRPGSGSTRAAEVLLEDLVELQFADVVDNDDDGFRYASRRCTGPSRRRLAGDSVPRQGNNTPKALRGLGRLDELATVSA